MYLLFGILMSVTIMFIFQSLLRYVYFLIPSLILILSIITNDMINNKKFYNLILIICIFLGIAKYDKTFVQIPNNLNLFFKKEKMIEFDKKHQPLKYLGKKINQDMNYKDKKIFILSNIDTPKFASFDMKVSFWTWHSLKIYMELITSGNLEKTLNKLEYDYLIYSKNYNVEEKSNIFQGDPRKIGKKIDESHGYVIHLLN